MKGLRTLNLIVVSLFVFAVFYGCAEEINEAKLEESSEIDSKIATHAEGPSAHHEKTTDAGEITTKGKRGQVYTLDRIIMCVLINNILEDFSIVKSVDLTPIIFFINGGVLWKILRKKIKAISST